MYQGIDNGYILGFLKNTLLSSSLYFSKMYLKVKILHVVVVSGGRGAVSGLGGEAIALLENPRQ